MDKKLSTPIYNISEDAFRRMVKEAEEANKDKDKTKEKTQQQGDKNGK